MHRCKTHEGRLPALQGSRLFRLRFLALHWNDIAFGNKSAKVERGEHKSPNHLLRLLEGADPKLRTKEEVRRCVARAELILRILEAESKRGLSGRGESGAERHDSRA